MVDLRPTNEKLIDRSIRIVAEISGLPQPQAAELLNQCHGEVKTAIVAALASVTPDDARRMLSQHDGHLRATLQNSPSA